MSEQPVASRLNSFTKYTASIWSPIMRFKENWGRKKF